MFVRSSPTSTSHPNGSFISRADARARSGSRASRSVDRKSKSVIKVLTAAGAAGLLFASYVLPAYAHNSPTPDGAALLSGGTAQTFTLELVDSVPLTGANRDAYTVTAKQRPIRQRVASVVTARSDSFANNPNNASIQWPLAQGAPISSGFGPRISPCSGCSSFHEGLDLNPGQGTPIYAIADGVVKQVGNPSGPFGVYAIIDHLIDGQHISSLYGHMLRGSLALTEGETVTKGELVGNVGSTGASSGPHLHLGIYLDNVPIDPFSYLKSKVGS